MLRRSGEAELQRLRDEAREIADRYICLMSISASTT